MNFERVDVSSLILYPKNSRKHDKKNLDVIKNSLEKFGQQKPVVVSQDNIVLAGNGLVMAAKSLGLKRIIIQRSELSKTDALAYAIADNRSSELSTWDEDILRETIRELNEINFDVEQIGFDLKDFGLQGTDDLGKILRISDFNLGNKNK